MKIAEAKKKTSKSWRTHEITWEQMIARLRDPMRTAETVREYRAMSREEQGIAKEAPGGFVAGALSSGCRRTDTVTERSMVTLDADSARPGQWERIAPVFDYCMACYSTHSHTEQKPRLRWLIPTDRAMTPDEYPAVARWVAKQLDIETMDPTTYELARLFYWPSCPKDGVYFFREQDGELLSVDAVLASYGCNEAWKDSTLWPIARCEDEIRLRRAREAGEPTEKNGMVGLFCRTYDIYDVLDQFLADIYAPTEHPDRFTYINGSTAGGAIVYNGGKFLYSNHATDPASGQSCNAFDLVRVHRFGELDTDATEDTPIQKRRSYAAMCGWAAELDDVKIRRAQERAESFASDFADFTGMTDTEQTKTAAEEPNAAGTEHTNAAAEQTAETVSEEDMSWAAGLQINSKTGECEPTINNALLILMNDPRLKGKFGYNKFSELPTVLGRLPWRTDSGTAEDALWTDSDEAAVRWYMQKRWNYKSKQDLTDALDIAMQRNSYHPVREYLGGLSWDGIPRLETVLARYMGAEDTELNRAMVRKWFTAAVARIMRPGCKFDSVLVLTGKQNLGKSSFARIISRGWFNDSDVNMQSKEGYDVLHGSWIIELAELASTKRSDIECVKTFLSKSEDKYRQAYMKHVRSFKRQCVFFGTTNELEILRDKTGARRFWIIEVRDKVDQDALAREVDQLWAEAKHYYEKGEQLYLDDEESAALEEAQAINVQQDEMESEIMDFLDLPLPETWGAMSRVAKRDYIHGAYADLGLDAASCTVRRDHVSIREIRYELYAEDFGTGSVNNNDYKTRRIAEIMNTSKYWKKGTRRRRSSGYENAMWVYERTKESADRWDALAHRVPGEAEKHTAADPD